MISSPAAAAAGRTALPPLLRAVLMLAIFQAADALAWTPDVRLTDALGSSDTPSLAADATGRAHLVWEDNRDGNSEIYYKRFENGAWSDDERLTNDPTGSYWPTAAVGPDSVLHVVWYDERDGNLEIYHKSWNGTWSADERLTNDPAVSIRPAIAITPSGGIHVVWYDARDGNFEIYWKWWNGTTWSPDTRLTDGSGSSREPDVAADASGDVHLVWSDDSSGDLEIYYERWDGTSWSSPERLTNAVGFADYPEIAVEPSGALSLVWMDGRDGSTEVFYKERVGGIWSDDLRLSDTPYWSFGLSQIVDEMGRVHVVWGDQRDGNYEIYYKAREGSVWSADQRVTDDPSSSLQPSVIAVPSDGVHLVWSDSRNGAGNMELYWKRTDPGVAIAIEGTTVAEGDTASTAAEFVLTLSAASADTVGVDFQTSNGTALAGLDYAAAAGHAVFVPGATADTVTMAVMGDGLDEDDETFTVTLSNAENASLATASAEATILDDDAPPSATIQGVSISEGNSGSTAFTFDVRLSVASGRRVSVLYTTADSTAQAASDYAAIAPPDTLSFSLGDTLGTITVEVGGDVEVEPDEVFFVLLSDPEDVTLAETEARGTILNDDAPQVSVETPVPARTFLGAAYPNPFSARVTLPFGLAAPGSATVRIFDVRGRLVRRLDAGTFPAGARTAGWDGRDESGGRAPSGLYIVRLETPAGTFTRTLKLVR